MEVLRQAQILAAVTLLFVSSAVAGRRGVAVPVPVRDWRTAQQPTGAIGGTVLDATTREPIPGALVSLRQRGTVTGQLTDAKGRFLFIGLPGYDGYALAATKAGYLDAEYPRESPNRVDRSAAISLAGDQLVLGLNVLMTRSGSIGGTLRDERDRPIVGARVRVLTDLAVAGYRRLAVGPAAETDDRGIYRIPGLRAGRYFVQLVSPQYTSPATPPMSTGGRGRPAAATRGGGSFNAPQMGMVAVDREGLNALLVGAHPLPASDPNGQLRVYPVTYHPSAAVIADASALDLGAGEELAGVDLRVTPMIGAKVAGQLEGPTSAALDGVPVRLMLPGTENLGDDAEVAMTVADESGRFTFLNIPAGTYILDAGVTPAEYSTTAPSAVRAQLPLPGMARVSGFSVASGVASAWVAYRPAAAPSYWGRRELSTDGRDVTGVIVTPRPLVTLSGRFVWEGPRRNTGVSTIVAQPADGDGSLGVLPAVPDPAAADRFLIPGLRPGRYVLGATPVMLAQGLRIKSLHCGGREQTHSAIDTTLGTDALECVLTLTDQIVELSGQVRDPAGRVSGDAAVVVFPLERSEWRDFGLTPARVKVAPVGGRGEYVVRTLSAGEYLAVAVPWQVADSWSDPRFLERASQKATRFRVSWGERARLDLTVVGLDAGPRPQR